MISINIIIHKYISEDPDIGMVACILTDAYGKDWFFVLDVELLTELEIDSTTRMPVIGKLKGVIVDTKEENNGDIIVIIDTHVKHGNKTVDGIDRFAINMVDVEEIK